jgi:stage II sporulation protein AA (anti-sigma F factor antagonist)
VHLSQDRLEVRGDEGDLTVVGELDAYTAPALATALSELLEPDASGPGELTLDLSGVTFVDSAALRILMLTRQQMADASRSFRLRAPSAVVLRLLEVSGLTDHFEFV